MRTPQSRQSGHSGSIRIELQGRPGHLVRRATLAQNLGLDDHVFYSKEDWRTRMVNESMLIR
jgi:hypothetical protein